MKSKRDVEQTIPYNSSVDPLDRDLFDEFVKRKIGSVCYVSEMPESIDGYVSIGIVRNEMTIDEMTNDVHGRLRCYDNVFKAYFDQGSLGLNVVFPSRKAIEQNFHNLLNGLTINSEECVMRSMGSKLLRITTVRNQINPLLEIINALAMAGELTMSDISSGPREMVKYRKYVRYLEDMGIVYSDEAIIQPGPVMEASGLDQTWNMDMVLRLLADTMGREEFMMLHEDLGFKNILPYLRMSNVNCYRSYAEDKALRWSWSGYEANLNSMYSSDKSFNKVKIINYATNLAEVNIFDTCKQDGKYMFSCNPVLDEYRSSVDGRKIQTSA